MSCALMGRQFGFRFFFMRRQNWIKLELLSCHAVHVRTSHVFLSSHIESSPSYVTSAVVSLYIHTYIHIHREMMIIHVHIQHDQVQKYLSSQGERYAYKYKLQPCIKTQLNSCII